MRRTWAFVFVVAAWGAAAACGSSSSTTNATDAGSDDAPIFFDSGATDAGSDSDYVIDTSVPDGGHVQPRYCAGFNPHPAFCDDFDYGALGATWDNLTVVTGGVGELDPTVSTSAPNSFHAASPVTTASDPLGSVFLRVTASQGFLPSSITYAFDYMPDDDPPTTGNFWIATLDLTDSHLFTLNLLDTETPPKASLQEVVGANETITVIPSLPPKGVWTRIYITMNLVAGTATISYGATKILDAIAIDKTASDAPTIRLGVFSEGVCPAFSAHFDGAVLQLTP